MITVALFGIGAILCIGILGIISAIDKYNVYYGFKNIGFKYDKWTNDEQEMLEYAVEALYGD